MLGPLPVVLFWRFWKLGGGALLEETGQWRVRFWKFFLVPVLYPLSALHLVWGEQILPPNSRAISFTILWAQTNGVRGYEFEFLKLKDGISLSFQVFWPQRYKIWLMESESPSLIIFTPRQSWSFLLDVSFRTGIFSDLEKKTSLMFWLLQEIYKLVLTIVAFYDIKICFSLRLFVVAFVLFFWDLF